MLYIVLICALALIGESIAIIKGDDSDTNKKVLYITMAIIAVYFVFFAYPATKPLGTYSEITEVKTDSGTYNLKVDINVENVEEEYTNNDDVDWVTIRVYKPKTIYWPNGGYTVLDPDFTYYSEKVKKYVSAVGYNEGEEYSIYIPEIEFSPLDKLLSMGWDLLLFCGPLALGIVAIVVMALKEREK